MIALLLFGILIGTVAVSLAANKFPMQIGDDEY